jgi:imidazolonepropionase-like amidohydrolase
MKFTYLLIFLLSCSSLNQVKIEKKYTLFKIGHLFDSVKGEWILNQSILVKNGLITEMNPGSIPEDTDVIDYSHQFVIPGLIDLHTHIALEDPTYARDFSKGLDEFFRKTSQDQRMRLAEKRGQSLIRHGFTSIRDLGNQGRITPNELRKLWKKEQGPRVFSSGAGFVPRNGQFPEGTSVEVLKEEYYLLTQTPDLTFGHHIATGADLLKLYSDEDPNKSFASLQVLKKWVRYAHKKGLKVATHAALTKGIELAIKSNTDTIEHGTDITEEQLKKMKKKGMILVPTHAQVLFLNPELNKYYSEHNKIVVEKNCKNIRSAVKNDVEIGFGSDNYFSLERENIEFGKANLKILLSYKDCGVGSREILMMATSVASKALGMEKLIGNLSIGHYADFILLNNDPLEDLKRLENPKSIYFGGVKI